MSKSYVAKTTINFVDFEFYVRPGDVLVHDTANHNRLTVYRNGQIVKVLKQEPLGIAAFLKNKFIVEPEVPAAVISSPQPTEKYVAKDNSPKSEKKSKDEYHKRLVERIDTSELLEKIEK